MSSNGTTISLTPAAAPSSELAETFGVLLVAFIFTVTLYGLTFFQTYIYYTRFPCDEKEKKYTVGVLWAVDTAITTLISHTIYHYLITDFATPFTRLLTTRTFIAEEALSVFSALVVQCYYAFRIWTVGIRRPMVPLAIVILALSSFGFNLASVIQMADEMFFSRMISEHVKLTKSICWGLSLGADLLIVLSLLWYLRLTRNPGMATPEGWYEKIVVYGVNRGACFAPPPSLRQVRQQPVLTAGGADNVEPVQLVTMPNQQVWILLHWVNSKVYVNSLLSMLNFRNAHRGRGVPEEASLNQHARGSGAGRSGTFMTRSELSGGPIDTSHSVQFNVNADVKTAEPMNIELDMVRSHGETKYGDVDSGKTAGESSFVSGGPSSKQRDLERDELE
ncbi:hypothetical protein C8Q79DRAFT_1013121 [Trametes meyenii]|nr:hypothetical protein C8Q79DRAFT_1013121 [Trametes meyenii]